MTETIDRELLVPATPPEVWRVVTGPGWLAEEVELELVPGGDARFAGGAATRLGWVEEACPPQASDESGHLTFWWSGDGGPASRVELRIDPADSGGTWVRVSESRPLEVLDLVGIPLPGSGPSPHGPALLAAA